MVGFGPNRGFLKALETAVVVGAAVKVGNDVAKGPQVRDKKINPTPGV